MAVITVVHFPRKSRMNYPLSLTLQPHPLIYIILPFLCFLPWHRLADKHRKRWKQAKVGRNKMSSLFEVETLFYQVTD